MNRQIRLGIVGCGSIVQAVHLPALAKCGQFTVKAFAEADDRRRLEAGGRLRDARGHADWREVVRDTEIDAILIALPTGLHAESAIAAFEAGKHVYLEKPISSTVADGRAVVENWRRSGRVGMTGFNYRFSPIYAELRRAIGSGRIGEIVQVRSVFSTTARNAPSWKRLRSSGGGVLLDLASHHVDLVCHLLGSRVERVSATVRSVGMEDDTAELQMTLTSGQSAQSFFSLASIEEDKIEVYGASGKLTADRYNSVALRFEPSLRCGTVGSKIGDSFRAIRQLPAMAKKALSRGYEGSYAAAFDTFARAIRDGVEAKPSLADGLRSLLVIDAAERSAVTGAAVAVEKDDECAPAGGEK